MTRNPSNDDSAPSETSFAEYLSGDQLAKLKTLGTAQALTPEELARSVLHPNKPRHDSP